MRTTILASLFFAVQIAAPAQGAAAQAPDPKLEFEVASVKISPPITGNAPPAMRGTRGGPGTADPARFTIGDMPMKTVLMQAFGVKALQISGPASLEKTDDHYDIVAKVPPGASKEDLKTMLQNLLVERFGLVFHRETKDLPGYELVIGKNGPKLKESEISADPPPAPTGQPFKLEMDRNGLPQLPAGRPGMLMGGGPGHNVMVARQQTLAQMANYFENLLGKPVVDKTGLTAKYDYGFAFDGTGLPGAFPPPAAAVPSAQTAGAAGAPPAFDTAPASAPSLFNVVQQELGLRLDQKKVTVELIVIDRLEKVPSEN